MEELSLIYTLIIAVVEGLTEFLPISSTGHMVILQYLLGIESTAFIKTFTVIIQFGAILSVICLYKSRFFRIDTDYDKDVMPFYKRIVVKYSFYYKLLIGFMPTAIIGFLLSERIDELLESVTVVAAALVLGGIFMLFVDRIFKNDERKEPLTGRKAFVIGLFQILALVPGVSRSMATIVGGMAQKLSKKEAAEFSFFLAIPTMLAASGYKVLRLFFDNGMDMFLLNVKAILVGNLVAFIVASLAIRFFIRFISKYGFTAFGWYRILVGGIILLMSL